MDDLQQYIDSGPLLESYFSLEEFLTYFPEDLRSAHLDVLIQLYNRLAKQDAKQHKAAVRAVDKLRQDVSRELQQRATDPLEVTGDGVGYTSTNLVMKSKFQRLTRDLESLMEQSVIPAAQQKHKTEMVRLNGLVSTLKALRTRIDQLNLDPMCQQAISNIKQNIEKPKENTS